MSRPRIPSLRPLVEVMQAGPQVLNTESWRADIGASSTARGYGYKWQQARAGYLAKHPLCVMCKADGMVRLATVVDHKVAHRGDQGLFWDRNNWQSLCKPHHDSEAQKRDRADLLGRRGGGE